MYLSKCSANGIRGFEHTHYSYIHDAIELINYTNCASPMRTMKWSCSTCVHCSMICWCILPSVTMIISFSCFSHSWWFQRCYWIDWPQNLNQLNHLDVCWSRRPVLVWRREDEQKLVSFRWKTFILIQWSDGSDWNWIGCWRRCQVHIENDWIQPWNIKRKQLCFIWPDVALIKYTKISMTWFGMLLLCVCVCAIDHADINEIRTSIWSWISRARRHNNDWPFS